MSIFTNKREVEEEQIEKDLKVEKGLKDLKPENKKKRKEPPKPWGKKERLVVLIFFLVTVIIAIILSLSSRDWKLPGLPRLAFPKFNFSSTRTYVISPSASPDVFTYWSSKEKEIINYFNSEVKPLTGNYVLYFQDLTDNYSFGVGDDEVMTAASLIKLPVIAALYQEYDEGNFDIDQKYVLKNSDKIGGSGSLYNQPSGTVLTFRQLAYLMGNQSDNTAFNIVRNTLGDKKIENVITNLGMNDTSLVENTTTAQDVGRFFSKLFKGQIVGEESQKEIIKSLTDTSYEAWLARDIKDVVVAHKFGREINVTNDAGIIFTDHPFILVILSKGIVYSESDEVIPQIAAGIYSLTK